MAVAKGYMAEDHKKVGRSLLKIGATVSMADNIKQLRVGMGLSAEPPTTAGDPKAMADFRKIMEITGFDKLIGGA